MLLHRLQEFHTTSKGFSQSEFKYNHPKGLNARLSYVENLRVETGPDAPNGVLLPLSARHETNPSLEGGRLLMRLSS